MTPVVVEGRIDIVDLRLEIKREKKVEERWWRRRQLLQQRCGSNGGECGVALWRALVVDALVVKGHGGVDLKFEGNDLDLKYERDI